MDILEISCVLFVILFAFMLTVKPPIKIDTAEKQQNFPKVDRAKILALIEKLKEKGNAKQND